MNHGVEQLLNELESHRLEVMLVPLNPNRRGWNDGGMKRICCDQNPAWYRRLCAAHTSSRGIRRGKHDTKLKRANVLALLRRLSAGLDTRSKYRDEILQAARRVAA